MKYFFLSFFAGVFLVMGVFGLRGQKFSHPPIEIFPDMDRQDFVKGQKPSNFFHDGMGARLPVKGTIPHSSDDGIFPVEFGQGRSGYYYTGAINDYFASGLPKKELGLENEADVQTLLRRGQERFGIYCTICHGEKGDGKGTVSRYMALAVANLTEARFGADQYPAGKLFHVITHGSASGNMSGYGANIPVRDRWAIVAYLRALQDSQQAPAPAGKETPAAAPAEKDPAAAPAEKDPAAAPADKGPAAEPAEKDPKPAGDATN